MKKMRKQVAAIVLAGMAMLAGGSALADGMRGSIKDAPVAAPTWSGFYLGLGLGYGHVVGENNYSESDGTFSSVTSEAAKGGLGTIVLGFDRQVRERYVVGLFTEFDWSSIELTSNDDVDGNLHWRIENTFSIGGRAGFLMTPTSLLYLTAGYSWAHSTSNGYFDIFNTVLFTGARSIDLQGPFVGIGMETQLTQKLSLRGEVRYTMFEEVTTNSGTLAGVTFVDKLEPDMLAGRIAVVYKFQKD
jgi:outer membrane immunogenic protein